MIFNIHAAMSVMSASALEGYAAYEINFRFVRSMLNEFSEDHLLDSERVMDEIERNERLLDRFLSWLRVNKGFASCEVWHIPSEDQRGYQPLLGFGFEINDDDTAFVKWKLSQE